MDGTLKTAKPLGLSRMLLKYHSKGKFKRVYWKKLIRKKNSWFIHSGVDIGYTSAIGTMVFICEYSAKWLNLEHYFMDLVIVHLANVL